MLGSHNSWSFGPTKWYIPSFVCRCQKLNIQEQYNAGVRLFDLRLRMSDYYHWGVSHGSAFFKINFFEDLKWLNEKGDCYVRIVLEYNKKPDFSSWIENYFCEVCEFYELTFPKIKFFGGNRKWDWNIVYKFKNPDEPLLDRYSSTTSLFKSDNKFLRIIDDWWPWLYAKLRNKKIVKEYNENGPFDKWLFIDFVNENMCVK